MSIWFKPILGGVFYPFWEGRTVSLMQMGALSRTEVDKWTTCKPDILRPQYSMKCFKFLSILWNRSPVKDINQCKLHLTHRGKYTIETIDWLCLSLGPYFGRSGSLLGPYVMKNWVPIWSFQGSAAVNEKETQVLNQRHTWQHSYVRDIVFGVFRALIILNGYV